MIIDVISSRTAKTDSRKVRKVEKTATYSRDTSHISRNWNIKQQQQKR